jgi:hypothetical protein
VYPAGSSAYGAPNQPGGPPPAPPAEPIFQVRVTKHVGALVFWYNQYRTVTGTYAQCDAALTQAQQHNLLLGWWSLASLLVWNPISLWRNSSARKTLRQQAAQAQHYAQWWSTNHGGRQHAPGWTGPQVPSAAPQHGWIDQ